MTPTKLPPETLEQMIKSGPLPGSVWKHRGSGELYSVVTTAIRESDLSLEVVYRNSSGITWTRPLSEFRERFLAAPQPKPVSSVSGSG